MMKTLLTRAPVAALALAGASATAASVEDVFRDYLARLRASGQVLREAPLALGQREITNPVVEKRIDQLPLGRNQYVVFVAPGCRSCDFTVRYLREKNQALRRRFGSTVDVQTLDLARSATAREAFALVGGQGVPTVLLGEYRVTGFSDAAYKEVSSRLTKEQRPLDASGQGS